MLKFFIGPFLTWFPVVTTALLFVFAVYLYINRERLNRRQNKLKNKRNDWRSVILNFRFAILLVVSLIILNAVLYTIGQYIIWSYAEFTNSFLRTPLDESVPTSTLFTFFPAIFQSNLGYFFFYSWGRFWLNPVILISVAYGFWAFLKLLKKHKERFFDTGEVELGLIISLLVGWPNFVIFIPMVFLFVVLVSIFRGIFLKEPYTTLGWPFIIAGATTIIWGDYLIGLFSLGVLRI